MMNIEYRQIRSVESADAPNPWYAVDVNDSNGDVEILEDKDGGRSAPLQNASTNIPDHVDLPDQAQVSGSGRVVYAVTENGEFVSYDPLNADPPPLRAHLGFYDPETDTLTLLEFVEE
jgi:hypothetical protein